jgi:hypothetical protein
MSNDYNSGWDEISFQVREEDGHRCTNCDMPDIPKSRYQLEVHHIDGNKWNDARENLVALCQECHKAYQNYRLADAMFFPPPKWVKRHLKRFGKLYLLKEQCRYVISGSETIDQITIRLVLRFLLAKRSSSRRPRSQNAWQLRLL